MEQEASVRVAARQDNVAGVKVPVFERNDLAGSQEKNTELFGLSKGGQKVSGAKDSFQRTVDLMIELASLQCAFVIIVAFLELTHWLGGLVCMGEVSSVVMGFGLVGGVGWVSAVG